MKIIHLVRYFYPHEGGVENFAKNMCVSQMKEGHEVFVITTLHTNNLKRVDFIHVGKQKVIRIYRFPYFLLLNEPLFIFHPLLLSFAPDLVIVHYPSPFLFLSALFIKFILGYRLKVIYHAKPSSSKIVSLAGKLFDTFVFVPLMVFVDEVIYTYRGLGPLRKNTKVLQIDVDKTLFKPMPNIRKEYDIIFVGRLVPVKRVDWLLYAIRDINPELKVLIIGDGPEKEKLMRLADRLGLKKIKFVGKVQNTYLPMYYNRSKLFVLPSRSEGYPISLLEAKACGLKILASDVGGIPSIVDKQCLFKSYPEMVHKIKEVLDKF